MTYTAVSHQGGDQDDWASLLGSCHVFHLYIQSIETTVALISSTLLIYRWLTFTQDSNVAASSRFKY